MTRLRQAPVTVLALFLGALVALAAVPAPAQEPFPSRPVQIVVPLPPGGAADLHARPLAQAMERMLKQPVVVVNKPGAGSVLGTVAVANSRADGHTLLIAMPGFFINPPVDALFGRPPKFTIAQFTPIARLSADPLVLVVHPGRPWKTFAELLADAKRRPGGVTYGTAGAYSGLHFPMEILAVATGITLSHVPYSGAGPAVAALLGGHVDAMASGPGPVLSHVKTGGLRALATWGTSRLPALPDVPTLKELGVDVEYLLPVRIVARKETPPAALQVIRDAVRQAVRSPEFAGAMAKLGTAIAYLGADEDLALWETETRLINQTLQRIGKIQ